MSPSGSAGPGFDPRRGCIFNLGARRGRDVHFLITRLYITGLDYIPNPSAVCMFVRRMGMLSLAAPLVLFEKSKLWAGTGFDLLPSFHHQPILHNTIIHYTNSYTYGHPNFNSLRYTIQILVPQVMWSAPMVRDLKINHTQSLLSSLRGTRSAK